MGKRMLIMLMVVGIVFGGLFGYQAFMRSMMKKYMSSGKVPPVTVAAMKATISPWQTLIRATGTLRAVKGVDVTTEVSGIIQGVFFTSGSAVKKDQILLKLNTDTDVAQLHALEAAAGLAKTVYARDKKQLKVMAVSQAVVDADAADLKNRRAQLAQQAAVIRKKIIRAPFDGKLGVSAVNAGQYLNPGEKIVSLQDLDQVFVDFYLPQQELSRVKVGQMAAMAIDAVPDRAFRGKITAINSKVDPDSRNVLIEALIGEARGALLPGMFASVRIEAGIPQEYVTLPQTAVSFNPYGETVFIVQPSPKDAQGPEVLTVRQVFVKVGELRGDQVSILEGVKQGDLVVTSGQHKLRNGSVVLINNSIQTSSDQAPQPVDQ